MVTSAAAGEGKTTTVINLGIIMAQAGPRVLIVDTDFRKPSIHTVMDLWPSRNRAPGLGLSNVMLGMATLDEVIAETDFERLRVVPAGAIPPNPSELLGSHRMQTLVSELKAHADVVIMDSAPCLAYSDALLLSRVADGVLYVLRAGNQDKAAQRRVQRQMHQAGVRLLGAVFNDVDIEGSTGGYGHYHANGHARRE